MTIAKSGIMVSLCALPVDIMGQGSVPGHIQQRLGWETESPGGANTNKMTPNVLLADFTADSRLA